MWYDQIGVFSYIYINIQIIYLTCELVWQLQVLSKTFILSVITPVGGEIRGKRIT